MWQTVPEAFCSTLQFMEKVVGIALESRLGKQTAVLRTVEQLSAQLEAGAPPSKKARPQPLILILALELWVMNISAARYTRAFAWAKLVNFWSSSRSDDLLGLVRRAFTLAAGGLCGVLQRTKNPRSWKKVKWLPIFVDRSASFAGVPCLETGFALWQEEGMCFECDYLVPLPTNNREACVQFMADYTAMCFFVERNSTACCAVRFFSCSRGAFDYPFCLSYLDRT